MLEVYVFVSKKKALISKIIAALFCAIGAFFICATLLGGYVILPVAVVCFAIGGAIYLKELEYEYSYFDGDFRFAKIKNKSKRKDLRGYEVGDVIVLAPAGDLTSV